MGAFANLSYPDPIRLDDAPVTTSRSIDNTFDMCESLHRLISVSRPSRSETPPSRRRRRGFQSRAATLHFCADLKPRPKPPLPLSSRTRRTADQLPRGPPAPARESVRTAHKLRIYVYELPAWLNMPAEMDFYASHERHDSIYSAYNLFYESLLQDWRALAG